MKFIKLFIILFAFSPLVFAQQTIQSDSVKLGRPNTNNKSMIFEINQGAANPRIRANGSTQKLEFTNDGTNYKNFGSGSGSGGGGVNFLADLNFDFEAGITNWSNTGGTFVASSTSPIDGVQSGVFTASAASQFFQSVLITKQLGAGGRSCSASFDYNWAGTSGQLTASVLDGSGNTIAGPVTLTPTTSTQTLPAQIPMFDCDAASQFRIRVSSTAASSAFKIDNAFIGYGRNTMQVSQAEHFGIFRATPGTNWTTTSASIASVTPVGSVTYSASGKLLQPDTNVPGFKVANLPPGKYEITTSIYLSITGQTNATNCQARLSDGTSAGDQPAIVMSYIRNAGDADSIGDEENTQISVFSYATAQTNKTFQVEVGRGFGNGSCVVSGASFTVRYYPLNANDAVNFETSGWFVDANIAGANPSLGVSTLTSYTEITDSSLSLTNAGPIAAQIACSGTNPSSGLTCSAGNESIGISFNLPKAGLTRACASFAHNGVNGTSSSIQTTFQLIETPNNAQTILQEGKTRIFSQIANSASASMSDTKPHHLCGTFYFSSAGQKTIRLMYEQTIGGTPASNIVIADALSSVGQRDIHWEVYPVNEQQPSPVFTDVQNKMNAGEAGVKHTSALINVPGGIPTVATQYPSTWISSIIDAGAGRPDIQTSYFSVAPICTCTVISASAGQHCHITTGNTASQISVITSNATPAAADASFYIQCSGK